ncbi:hypothetical protein XSR1_290015 [Xenorhabdus szentirmaii DSM 16338]|uniref:Uncharacterized protein n=1 Tax=Xenorhabdus szentirmaii DSM 16338 TaxID=1427518 RepID=W1IX61_9GAMM|nr:hypothetical protein XSR1_290015 [Xenorhabdus szentirmaii DSM 16338]
MSDEDIFVNESVFANVFQDVNDKTIMHRESNLFILNLCIKLNLFRVFDLF